MPVSSWPWKDRWWTSEKVTWNGNDATAQAGAILVPWAVDAKPVTEARKWDIEYIYTTAVASQVTVAQNMFREPGEAGNAGQELLATLSLAPGTRMVLTARVSLHEGQPLWTPQFSIPDGQPPVTFHRIAAWPAQKPAPDPPAITIRSHASSLAVGGGGAPMSCQSQVGDVAILMMASQWGNTGAHAPAGWTVQHSSNVGGRSGFIAALKVTDPAQTQNVAWTGATASAARERAALVVLTGVEDFTLHGWQTAVPEISGLSLVVSQQHGAARGGIEMWTQDVQSGAHSNARSWSVLLAGLVPTAPNVPEKDAPQAWAWADLAPVKVPDPPPTDTVEIAGETTPGRVRVLTGAEEVPARIAVMPAGYTSVEAMLATRGGFAVAHRGGSASWPEASMRAYTNAVAHSAGALEISCQQTTDGVWVLAHDQTLRRVDPTAPNTPLTQMTWAQVQAYRTQGEPLVRVEQVLDAYATSHVIVLDPKYSATSWRALAALLPEGARERVIWKFSVDATWLARQWVADGWRCWGYSYPEHVTTDQLTGWQEPWTYLGMSWDAPEEVWDKTLSYGKPVWGHVCPTRTAYDTALAKGAAGAMVSGIASLHPASV